MSLRRVIVLLIVGGAVLAGAQAGYAQSSEPRTPPTSMTSTVEVTPFVGFGSAGASRVGSAVAFVWTPKIRLESEFAYHRDALFSTSLNLVYSLPRVMRVEPYVTGGLGVGQIETATQAPTPGGFLVQRSLALVLNAGTGLTVPVRERVGYRVDARWSNPLGIAPETWRIYQGATLGVGGK
jgi:hypothetical protein